MLNDPILSVRTEAARILSRSPSTLFSEQDRKLFREVFRELKKRYEHNLDRPESHLSLGILAENQGDALLAEEHYRSAIIREDTYVPARMNLATLLSRRGVTGRQKNFSVRRLDTSPTGVRFIIHSVFYLLRIVLVYRRLLVHLSKLRLTVRTIHEFLIT